MGILTSTIKFKGSIGNELTAYELNGQTIIRKKCVERYRSNTYQQREYRNKFKVVNNFLRGMGDYFRLSFAEMFAMKRNTYSLAVKYNLACAVKGEGSEHYIDYAAAVLGDGPLTPIRKAKFYISGEEIIVEWDDNSGDGSALDDDFVLPVVFDKTLNLWIDNAQPAKRADGQTTIITNEDWLNHDFECWITCCRRDKSLSSQSVYFGQMSRDDNKTPDSPNDSDNDEVEKLNNIADNQQVDDSIITNKTSEINIVDEVLQAFNCNADLFIKPKNSKKQHQKKTKQPKVCKTENKEKPINKVKKSVREFEATTEVENIKPKNIDTPNNIEKKKKSIKICYRSERKLQCFEVKDVCKALKHRYLRQAT